MARQEDEAAKQILRLGFREIEQNGSGHRQFVHRSMPDDVVTLSGSASDLNGPKRSVREAYLLLGLTPPANKRRSAKQRKRDAERQRLRQQAERQQVNQERRRRALVAERVEQARRRARREEREFKFFDQLMRQGPGA